MVTCDFSEYEVAKVLANAENFELVCTTGDHAICNGSTRTVPLSSAGP